MRVIDKANPYKEAYSVLPKSLLVELLDSALCGAGIDGAGFLREAGYDAIAGRPGCRTWRGRLRYAIRLAVEVERKIEKEMAAERKAQAELLAEVAK